MQSKIKDYYKPVGSTPGLTRSPSVGLDQGITEVNKLPGQLLCLKNEKNIQKNFVCLNNIKITKNKFNRCKNGRCKTCPRAAEEQISIEPGYGLFCKCSELIYCIECLTCNLLYVGQTGNELSTRINSHRSCIKNQDKREVNDYEILHFKIHSFENIKIYILKEFLDLNNRLNFENIFICNLQTVYPYGLNSKLNGEGSVNLEAQCIYGKFNFLDSGLRINKQKRGNRGRKHKNIFNGEEVKKFMIEFQNLEYNAKSIKKLREFIFQIKNKILKKFLYEEMNNLSFNSVLGKVFIDLCKWKLGINLQNIFMGEEKRQKIYCVINFLDRDFEFLRIPNVLQEMSCFLPKECDIDIKTSFKYSKTLRKILCNYNFFGKNLNLINNNECFCKEEHYSTFINSYHKHVITGNLDIIKNRNLSNLLKLGSKFRLRKFFGLKFIISSIRKDLDLFLVNLARKIGIPIEAFGEWRARILNKIKKNYSNFYLKNCDGIFLTKTLKKEIELLKNKFIILVVDKAANNFCFVCKKFFKETLMHEYNSNSTYSKVYFSKKELQKRILAFSKKLKIKASSLNLPYLFPTVKFHKEPIKFRFVTCSTNCYNSNFGKKFFIFLKIILEKIKIRKKTLIINNNKEVINYLNNFKVDSINTYDFENLYTNIPHNQLKEICSSLYDVFLNNEKISKIDWLDLCNFNLFENYVFNGMELFRQTKGIPMGTCFSSAFANIFLDYYEFKIGSNFYFDKAFRYIDDLIVFNLKNEKEFLKIYPDELNLVKTNQDIEAASYLDLNIRIKDKDKKIQIGLYDKRNDFDFKVIQLTNFKSNLSKRVFRNIYFGQINRICNICNNFEDFLLAYKALQTCFKDNNYPNYITFSQGCKIFRATLKTI